LVEHWVLLQASGQALACFTTPCCRQRALPGPASSMLCHAVLM
jgi:hypothetical protein